ncbi:MAG: hypothetical protein PUC97_01270 [bacterium]|nr:hypothetical protein [bacterium]
MGKWLNGAQARKREIDGKDTRIAALAAAGAAQIAGQVPVATAGLFAPALPAWKPGTSYAQYAPFVHDGVMYFTRQAVTAMGHQPPGSTGMEAIYGVRPVPDADGIYPYVYNMAASAGMRVREGDAVYVCTREIDPLLYPPSQVAAHFDKEVSNE